MRRKDDPQRSLRSALRTARTSAMLYGLALLAYGIAPAVTFRLSTGDVPPMQTLAVGSGTLVVGLVLLLLGVLVGRGVLWALWVTVAAATVLLVGTLALTFTAGASVMAVFPALMAVATAATCWLAIEAQRTARRTRRLWSP